DPAQGQGNRESFVLQRGYLHAVLKQDRTGLLAPYCDCPYFPKESIRRKRYWKLAGIDAFGQRIRASLHIHAARLPACSLVAPIELASDFADSAVNALELLNRCLLCK